MNPSQLVTLEVPGNNGHNGSATPSYYNETKVLKVATKVIRGRKVFVFFSGGKDSLVSLHILKRLVNGNKEPLTAIHTDTGISTPGNREYVEKTCRELGVKLVLLSPKDDYFTLVKRWGFPTLTRRWCKWQLKIFPVQRFLRTQDKSKILLVDGVRGAESWIKKRMNHQRIGPLTTFHNVLRCPVFHPVYEWSHEAVEAYIEKNGLEVNPLYAQYGKAFDCWCSVYKTPSDLVMLKYNHNSLFKQLISVESSLTSSGSGMFDRGRSQRIYFRDIDKNPDKYVGTKCSSTCACMTA